MSINTNILNLTERLIPMSIFSKGQSAKIFDDISTNNNEYIVLKNNEPVCVMMSMKEYKSLVRDMEKFNQLLEEVENEELLAIALERKDTVNKDAIPFSKILEREGLTKEDLDGDTDDIEID